MKLLALLEVGDLGGVFVMISGIILLVALSVSFIFTIIVKVWYEKDDKKFSRKQFIQTMLISLLLCGLVSGVICGGGL
jgi:hypothetical protein